MFSEQADLYYISPQKGCAWVLRVRLRMLCQSVVIYQAHKKKYVPRNQSSLGYWPMKHLFLCIMSALSLLKYPVHSYKANWERFLLRDAPVSAHR